MIQQRRKRSSLSYPSFAAEARLRRRGFAGVAGVDEVGRGAWAGPLVAAAALIDYRTLVRVRKQPWFVCVRDSKVLTPKVREVIARACTREVHWVVAEVTSEIIDQIGISEANRRAVQLVTQRLKPKPDYVLADYVAGLADKLSGIPARVVIRGDATVFSIALASIIAKVHRDRLMFWLDKKYPGYGFAQHKGYGTSQHRAALQRLGPCPIHRLSYRPVARALL